MMRWLELSVETEAAAVETVSAILHEHGEGGVAVYQQVVPDDEDAAYHYDTARPTTVTTYVPATLDGERRRAAIAAALGHLTAFNLAAIGPVQSRTVDEEDWANAWKRYFQPMRFGRRLVVKPSWRDYPARPGDLVIEIDPGMAFGTGLHQTTAMCLEMIEDCVQPGARVLDQGTGSGILALAAALLGAARVVAVDNSEVAVEAAHENAARNGFGDVVDARLGATVPGDPHLVPMANRSPGSPGSHGNRQPGAPRYTQETWEPSMGDASLSNAAPMVAASEDVAAPPAADAAPGEEGRALAETFDVVIANIIANVIIALAPAFAAVLKPGGPLLCSGIIRDREDDVRAALAALGFTVERREARDEWVALVARR